MVNGTARLKCPISHVADSSVSFVMFITFFRRNMPHSFWVVQWHFVSCSVRNLRQHLLLLTYSYFTLLIWDLYLCVWYSNSTDLSLYLTDLTLYLTDLTLYLTDLPLYLTDLPLYLIDLNLGNFLVNFNKRNESSGKRTLASWVTTECLIH